MAGALQRRLVATLLVVSGLTGLGYSAVSALIAVQLVYETPKPVMTTPASLGLTFRDVAFSSRTDHLMLRGWFIPGVGSDRQLTARRVIVMVHGTRQNRTDSGAHELELSAALARRGYAILAFDMRGMGQSPPAPLGFGSLEFRDVEGVVDLLRFGPVPFPELGRPRIIGAWGVSMGAATLLLASAHEPAIAAVVADSPYADILPLLEREVPRRHVPTAFTLGALSAAQVVYGVDYFGSKPVDAIGRLAPRPLLLIHGLSDRYVPLANSDALYSAATVPANAHVARWLVPGATHAQAFPRNKTEYLTRVVAFFDQALGPDAL
jgi:dipeptidyl aminopeptidase/acylaminoacyl peptidase